MKTEDNDHLFNFLQTKTSNYKDVFESSVFANKISFQTSNISADWTYASMHIIAQSIVLDCLQQKFERQTALDVGSQFSFITFLCSFFDVTFVEHRIDKIDLNVRGLYKIEGLPGEAQDLPLKNEQFDLVTSLHAIEHFGLGRYGDNLDYYGDQKGIFEFSRVLSKNGFLLMGVPAAKKSSIEFNNQRKYNPKDFDAIVSQTGLQKKLGLISYAPGSYGNIVVGNEDTLEDYPEHFTPPVYISLYQK